MMMLILGSMIGSPLKLREDPSVNAIVTIFMYTSGLVEKGGLADPPPSKST
jgi:hypothetical protein